jgi:hypothetical protein
VATAHGNKPQTSDEEPGQVFEGTRRKMTIAGTRRHWKTGRRTRLPETTDPKKALMKNGGNQDIVGHPRGEP